MKRALLSGLFLMISASWTWLAELDPKVIAAFIDTKDAEINSLLSMLKAERGKTKPLIEACRIYAEARQGFPTDKQKDHIEDAGWQVAQAYRALTTQTRQK